MTVPQEVKLARHAGDLDDDGHDTYGGASAPASADYLVGTASGSLSAEIVVGTTPGGELGGTWASPTVDTTHSGSSHAAAQAAAEATAAAALAAHAALPAASGVDHVHVDSLAFSGDGSTTVFELPAAPFDAWSVAAYVAGLRTAITLSGTLLTTMTFGSAPASGTDNVTVDIAAAVA